MSKESFLAAILLLLLFLMSMTSCVQGQAASLYLYGKPELEATIEGSSEIIAGEGTELQIIVGNHGRDPSVITDMYTPPGTIDPVIALGVIAELQPGSAPVIVESSPQFIGNLGAGEELPVFFHVSPAESAPEGNYELDLVCRYRYAWASDVIGEECLQYLYREETVHIPLQVKVSGVISPVIMNISGENIYPGKEGSLYVTLTHSGPGTAYSSSIDLVPDPNGPVHIVEGTCLTGTFGPEEVKTAGFRVMIDDSVRNGTFPATLQIQYQDEHGDFKTGNQVPIGIDVSRGPRFSIVSHSPVLAPGQSAIVPLNIKNTGDGTAYRAAARVIQSSIITAPSGTIILGDIKPGSDAGGNISLSVDINALPKSYALNAEVKYYDPYGNLELSDPMVMEVVVQEPPMFSILSFSIHPEIPLTIIAVLIIAGYAIFRWRSYRKNR